MLGWLFGKKNSIKSQGESVVTRPGKAAYKIAQEISQLHDPDRWKEIMDLYYKTTDPEAKVEVLRMATALAKEAGVTGWKRDVKMKTQELQKHGYM